MDMLNYVLFNSLSTLYVLLLGFLYRVSSSPDTDDGNIMVGEREMSDLRKIDQNVSQGTNFEIQEGEVEEDEKVSYDKDTDKSL